MSETKKIRFELRRKFPTGSFTSHIDESLDGKGLAVKLCILLESDQIDFRNDHFLNYVQWDWKTETPDQVRFGTAQDVMCALNPYTVPPGITRMDDFGIPVDPSNGFKLKLDIYPGGKFYILADIRKRGSAEKITLSKSFTFADFANPGPLQENVYTNFTFMHIVPNPDEIDDPVPQVDPVPLNDPIPVEDEYEVQPEIEYKKPGLIKRIINKIDEFLNRNKWYFFIGLFIAGFTVKWII